MMDLIWFPFFVAGIGLMMLVGILLLIFWIAMLIDVAKRSFRNETEKIVWIVILAVSMWLAWVPPFVYYIVIKRINPKGLSTK
jgi:membrane-bound ClpP family serine protease